MSYPIQEVEGIGPAYAKKLAPLGISTTAALLAQCADPSGRKKVCEASGIAEALILKWANLADLMRIRGIGCQFSELLEASGVDTVKELKHRKAENLAAKLAEVNAAKKLTRRVPNAAMVARWIAEAGTLPPAIRY